MIVVSAASAAAPTPGDIIVSRLGDVSPLTNGAAAPVFLDEYEPDGTLVQTTALPTAVNGAQKRLTMSSSATSEGALSLSADGRFVTLAGYDAAPGTTSVASSIGVNRVIGRFAADGTVDTGTSTTAYDGNNIRGAVSDDGTHFWAAGPAGGIQYFPALGSTTSTQINALNSRVPLISAGQLYVSSGSAPAGLNKIGNGLPPSAATVTSIAASTSPYGAVFLDRDAATPGPDTLYLADDTMSPSTIGLRKFALIGGSWVNEGNYSGSGPLRGLTGTVSNGNVVLWAVTAGANASPTSLVQLTDTAAFDAAPTITPGISIPSGTNRIFRGVAFVPQAPTPTPTPTPTSTPTPTPTPTLTPTSTPAPTPAPTNTAPTIIPSSTDPLPLTVDDPFNPPATRTVTVADAERV
jgi:hypothetical protein